MKALTEYRRKRKFSETPEPRGGKAPGGAPIFVVQRHSARRLHFDFRLEVDGTLKSWAVPKGPPLAPGEKRLAVHVEDHPLEYAKFEGQIPAGHYGAGDVQIWDQGTFQTEEPPDAAAQLARGDFKFRLAGERLRGRYVLVKLKKSERGNEWLLIRKDDAHEVVSAVPPDVPAQGTGKAAAKSGRRAAAVNPAKLAGAIEAPMPAKIPAALATLADQPFSDPDWLFEIKWDGERALAFVRDGTVELRARSGRNITAEYPELKVLPRLVNARHAIVDGEIVALDESGHSDFSRIQNRFGVTNPSVSLLEKCPATYYLFDLVYCDGYDLRRVALHERKNLLRQILNPTDTVRFSDHQPEQGKELLELARAQGLEGVVGKQRNSLYAGGRSRNWLKFKVVQDLDAVVGGWMAPRKSRDFFGALLLGLYRGGRLHFIGNVGTGFSQHRLGQIYEILQPLHTRACPFETAPATKETAHWVKPELVARVKFAEWTDEKRLRAPVFLGFREDVSPRDCEFEAKVTKEPAVSAKETSRHSRVHSPQTRAQQLSRDARNSRIEETLASGSENTLAVEIDGKKLSLTNLNKIFFPESGFKKRDLLLYYFRIAPYILPFLKDRPLVLKRYPNGIEKDFFFQKEAPSPRPEWLKTVMVYSDARKAEMPYFLAEDRASLVYLANLGCIDQNPWSSRLDDEEHPDFAFFDLDPSSGATFETVLQVARALYRHLDRLGVRTYLKTSGASGFHLFVPLERNYTYQEVRMFVDAIGQRAKQELPGVITSERTVSRRKRGTVLLDALQNAHGKPLASVYSARPFPGAPVSTPVSPAELSKGVRPEELNIRTIFPRLERVGDLWADFWQHRQRLEAIVAKA